MGASMKSILSKNIMNFWLNIQLKIRLDNYCRNISIEMIFINTENSKRNEPRKFAANLSQRLDLRRSNKHVTLPDLSIYYTWRNIRKLKKINKLEIIAPT